MKKVFCFALYAVMAAALASCGKSSAKYTPPSSAQNFPSSSIMTNESEKVDNHQSALSSYNKVDENEWIYGTWRCFTPYGTIEVILKENGKMYDGIEQRWCDYTIEGNRIIEQLNGGISSYNIDRVNKRFDCGEPGYWFKKVE